MTFQPYLIDFGTLDKRKIMLYPYQEPWFLCEEPQLSRLSPQPGSVENILQTKYFYSIYFSWEDMD